MSDIEVARGGRGAWWWFMAILAPIGILGGPIAIAEMFSELIYWKSPIQYIVQWWGVHISEPFHRIFEWFAQLAGLNLPLPSWTKWVTDYVVLGLLFFGNEVRAWTLYAYRQESGAKSGFNHVSRFAIAVLFWPRQVMVTFLNLMQRADERSKDTTNALGEHDNAIRNFVLVLAPFALYFLLWLVNFTLI
jgi:hypothetical protein